MASQPSIQQIFGGLGWHGFTAARSAQWNRNTNKLEQVQRHSAQYVTGNQDYNCSATRMVQDLGWPTLEQRCRNSRLTMMYKIFSHQVDSDFSSKCSLSQSITRGHTTRIVQPQCSCVTYSNSFPRTTRDWNVYVLPVHPSTFHIINQSINQSINLLKYTHQTCMHQYR